MAFTHEKALRILKLSEKQNLRLIDIDEALEQFKIKATKHLYKSSADPLYSKEIKQLEYQEAKLAHQFLYQTLGQKEFAGNNNVIRVKINYDQGTAYTPSSKFATLTFNNKTQFEAYEFIHFKLPNVKLTKFKIVHDPLNKLTMSAKVILLKTLLKQKSLLSIDLGNLFNNNNNPQINNLLKKLEKSIEENINKVHKKNASDLKAFHFNNWLNKSTLFLKDPFYLCFVIIAATMICQFFVAAEFAPIIAASFIIGQLLVTHAVQRYLDRKGQQFKKAHPINDENITPNQASALRAGIEASQSWKGYFSSFTNKNAYTEFSAFQAGKHIHNHQNTSKLDQVKKLKI